MERLAGLDGLRGVLAVYVMTSHMAPFAALPAWLARLLSHGGAAVDVFFVLSGLAIVQSLRKFGCQTRPFLLARAGRIFPAYLAVFFCAVAVQPLPTGLAWMPWIEAGNPGRAIWSEAWPETWALAIATHLSMLHGIFPHAALPDVWVAFLGAAWSLSTEWQFYMAALVLARSGMGVRWMAVACIGIAIGGAAWEALGPDSWRFSRAFLPNKAHYFALGIASWALVKAIPPAAPAGAASQPWPKERRRETGKAIAFYLAILTAAAALAFMSGGIGKLLPPLVWTVCLAVELRPGAMLLARLGSLLRARPTQWLGAISYSLYLVNEPVQKLIGVGAAWIAQGNSAYFAMLWIPLALLAPMAIAVPLHRWVEQPARRWIGARVRACQLSNIETPGLCSRSRASYTDFQ